MIDCGKKEGMIEERMMEWGRAKGMTKRGRMIEWERVRVRG